VRQEPGKGREGRLEEKKKKKKKCQ
jgi:hypothetical protein